MGPRILYRFSEEGKLHTYPVHTPHNVIPLFLYTLSYRKKSTLQLQPSKKRPIVQVSLQKSAKHQRRIFEMHQMQNTLAI